MNITILSDIDSWINTYIPDLVTALAKEGHLVTALHNVNEIPQGDIVFCLGCSQIIPKEILSRNKNNIVVHESALPKGKGWSPLTWQILEGAEEIPITLFEADEEVDSGLIYISDVLKFEGTELVDELRSVQAKKTFQMCLDFVQQYPSILAKGKRQKGESSFYSRRRPKDSQLDVDKSIREQFNLLRVVDNERYPAFFEISGQTYILKIEKKKWSHNEND